MLKIKTLLSVAVAVSGAALAANCSGQTCHSCAQPSFAPAQVAAPCDTCGPAVAPGGCSTGGCIGGGGRGARLDELKAKCAHQRAINARIAARNNAWPMPFDCADRQLYFSYWGPMIDQGWEEQCVLTADHFDPQSGELNKFGKTAIAGVMQNHPSNRRTIFIKRDVDDSINQQRRSTVEDTINTFYGHTTTAQVAFSNKVPVTTSGERGHQIQTQWLGSQPAPAIQVGSGGSVANSVSTN